MSDFKTVAPVVVKPETVSKRASAKNGREIRSGKPANHRSD